MSTTIRTLLAGIGFLLFSLDVLESGFANTSKGMSTLLRTFTKTKRGAILTGSLATAVLQSSAITALITLALVGSGVLGLTQAIGIILGANIGTTLFDGLVGYIGISGGFGIDISTITSPLIAIGGFGMIFLKRWKSFFVVLMSMGLMFFSLELIKSGVSDIKSQIDITWILGLNYGLVFLIGMILTIIMQSSSTMTLLALTFLSQGVIGFEECLALILGAYLGTCITVVIGAIGGSTIKKQVATSHVLFNVIFCSVALLLFKPIIRFLKDVLAPFIVDPTTNTNNQAVQLISLFHIFAKAIGVICFYPFIDRFKKLIEKIIPKHEQTLGLRIESRNPGLSQQIKKEFLEQDSHDLWKKATHHIQNSLLYPSQHDEHEHKSIIKSASLIIHALQGIDTVSEQESHNTIDAIQHIMYATNDSNGILMYLDRIITTDNTILKQYYADIQKQFHDIVHGHQGYEQQKSLLQKIKFQDNDLIEHNEFTTEQITLLSSINHAFYQCCKNLLVAKDLM